MWLVIIEQLVNSTCLLSVNANIAALVKSLSPSSEINEMPSIWTVCHARTVLLLIVHTLVTLELAKLVNEISSSLMSCPGGKLPLKIYY